MQGRGGPGARTPGAGEKLALASAGGRGVRGDPTLRGAARPGGSLGRPRTLNFQLGLETDTREATAGAHKGPMKTGTSEATLLGGRGCARGARGSASQRRPRPGPPRRPWIQRGGIAVPSERQAESGTAGRRKSRLVRTGQAPGHGPSRGLTPAGWVQRPVLTLRMVRHVRLRF